MARDTVKAMAMEEHKDRWMTVPKVADYLELGSSTVCEMGRRAQIPCAKDDGQRRSVVKAMTSR